METRIAAVPLLAAIGFGAPLLAQEPAPPTPIVRSAEDARTDTPRIAKPRPPSEPVRADEPARVEVQPAPSGATVDRSNPEVSAQRRGGGGGGGGRQGGGGGSAGGDRRGGGRPAPVYVRPVYSSPWGTRGWYGRPYFYDPWWTYGAFGWSPFYYAPWSLMWGTSGYGGYPWLGGASTFNTGGVRLKVRPRDAQVYVDGYYAGLVDDFDGNFQSLRLAPGGHKIEVRMPGYDTQTFDVHVQPDRTLTLKEDLKAVP